MKPNHVQPLLFWAHHCCINFIQSTMFNNYNLNLYESVDHAYFKFLCSGWATNWDVVEAFRQFIADRNLVI